jgi:hypothetical protein
MMSTTVLGSRPEWRDYVSDALAFWEPGRLAYNVVLLAVTGGWLVLELTGFSGIAAIPLGGWLALIILAAIANCLYCAAYPVDVLLQFSNWRAGRAAWRTALWLSGTILAVSLASLLFWLLAVGGEMVI